MSNQQLAAYFRAQAEWRDGKAAEYPDDHRNAQSATALRSLAEFAEESESDGLEHAVALQQHLHDGGLEFGGEQARRAVARYGYGYGVTSRSHGQFLEELRALCLQDAYEFVSEDPCEADPTGPLHDFEVDAALEAIVLDGGYWTRRAQGHMSVQDLEDWVQEIRDQDTSGRTTSIEKTISFEITLGWGSKEDDSDE
jgi:hypothetical protein